MDQLRSTCAKAVHGARRPEGVGPDYETASRSADGKNKEKMLQTPFEKISFVLTSALYIQNISFVSGIFK